MIKQIGLTVLAFIALKCDANDITPKIDAPNVGPFAPSGGVKLLAIVALVWYIVVLLVAYNGFFEIIQKFSKRKTLPVPPQVEGVTILRPIKGIDPEMELCLQSAFDQDYPKFEIIICVENENDPGIGVAEALIRRYPQVDARILKGDSHNPDHFGPNPKVNNLAKGYSAGKYDIMWILDSNVWVCSGALSRSVDALNRSLDNGRSTFDFQTGKGRKVNLVHHVPMAISINPQTGTNLDEMFLFTSHSKFYISINKAALAPCVNGKSNLYRRSELDSAVKKLGKGSEPSLDGATGVLERDAAYYGSKPGQGLRFFARYIGEDNMIATALWFQNGGRTGLTGDAAIQPLGGINSTSLKNYLLRRIRWLRVRKHMVLEATLLEPTTECLLCGTFGTFGISTLFLKSFFKWKFFIFHLLVWMLTDYTQFHILLTNASQDTATCNVPYFAKPSFNAYGRPFESSNLRTFHRWVFYWLLREVLALPIWISAMLGTRIIWRNRPFRINVDLSAEEL
ncbi:BA75_00378T0 [Komagataella pastoris]|uniref:Ceramide glucosyltransferase n=1 Tax=Komagataella pastoris TaxID=4922 RepID=A0A1B2J8N8_PICPA|nr:BA75_00378T0 [Komagataella pastoris]